MEEENNNNNNNDNNNEEENVVVHEDPTAAANVDESNNANNNEKNNDDDANNNNNNDKSNDDNVKTSNEEFTDDEGAAANQATNNEEETANADATVQNDTPVVFLESIGSSYQGEWKHNRMDGFGRYTFSNGNYYVGYFSDGQFEGEGTLFFPGRGKYVGVWKDGRAVSGDYIFADNLLYQESNWEYCSGKSRMFWSEIEHGVQAAGAEQVHNERKAPKVPKGCYDVGDGWYFPKTGKIYTYENEYLRTPNEQQVQWITSKCRLVK